MFEIIRQTINSIGNVIESKHICFIDCEEDFLMKEIAPFLYTISECETSYQILIKSDKKIAYKVKRIITFDNMSYEKYFENILNEANEKLSNAIKQHNAIIKRQNARNGITKHEDLIPEVKAYQYIKLFSSFNKEQNVIKLNDGLLIL